MRTRNTAGASPLAAELPPPTRRRKAAAHPAGPPAKKIKTIEFATERVTTSEPARVPSPAVVSVKSPEPASIASPAVARVRTPTPAQVSSPAIESEDDEPTPAATSGPFGSAREVSRPRPTPRRRFLTSKATPVNDAPQSSLPFTAPPAATTTVAEDFAGLLPSSMTPRPYALKTPMVRPGQLAHKQPTPKPEKEKSNGKEKELFAPSDDEDDDAEASIHEEEYPQATPQQIRDNSRLVFNVNQSYHQHQEHLRIYAQKGLGNRTQSAPNRSATPDQIIIQIKEVVEKVVPVPGPSMPAEFPQNTLVIPASDQGDQMILTDPRIIELARAAAVFLTSDPAHQLPHPSQMTEFLQRFNETGAVDSLVSDNHLPNNHSADPFDALVTNKGSSDHHDDLATGTPFAMGKTYDQDNNEVPYEIAMTNGLGSHVYAGEESEVEGPASSPFIATPARLPNNTPVAASATSNFNRGFFSGVKSLLTSPLKKFGLVSNTPRGSTTETDVRMADNTPPNGARMGGDAPATIDRFDITPSTDINFSPTELRDPKSPTPFNKRVHNKRKIQKRNASILKSQSKEAQRMQDNIEGDVHREDREKKRVAFVARDEVRTFTPVTPDLSPPQLPKIKKSKIKQPKPKKEGYSVPSDSETTSEEEDESPEKESPPQDATYGSQKRRHDGSRIDSHYDESSTSPAAGTYSNRDQPTRRHNNGYENFLKLQAADPNYQPALAYVNGRTVDMHRDSFPWLPMCAYDKYSTTPLDSSHQYQSPTSQTTGTFNNKTGNMTSDASTSLYGGPQQSGSRIDSHHDESSKSSKASNFSQFVAPTGAKMQTRPFSSQTAGTDHVEYCAQFFTPNGSLIDSNTIGTGSQIDSHHDESARSAQASGFGFAPLDPLMGSTTVGTGSQIDSHHDESARYAQTSDSQTVVPFGNENESSTDSASPAAPRSPGRSFCVPDWSDSESDEEEDSVAPKVLDEKTNEQAVPAPPRPANAVLPPPYNKYVPEKKSFLSFMENMSPMQVAEAEKENNPDPWEAADAAPSPSEGALSQEMDYEYREGIDPSMAGLNPEVVDYIDSLPDEMFVIGFQGVASF